MSVGAVRSTVRFGDRDLDFEQASTNVIVGLQMNPRLGLVASVGFVVAGSIDLEGGGDLGVGETGSLTANSLLLFETRARPFVLASVSFGALTTTADSDDGESHRWTALDLRAGMMIGKTFFDRLVPFAAARAFVGPVTWKLAGENVTGSDIHKYTVGAGLTFRVPGKLDLYAEAMPLGAQSLSVGGSAAF